ncbi:MAG: hypothetical protein AAFY81_06055 [Pseudomonadota bacterium]
MSNARLPPVKDYSAIAKFAGSFNGYEHFGSFKACSEAAKAKSRDNLDAIRNELFFAYRAANHTGDTNILLSAYEELLPLFERYLI